MQTIQNSKNFRIAAYIRVSTQEQAENPEGSIKNQKERIIQTVKLKNMEGDYGTIVDFFIDSGLSGKDTKRPELQRLLKSVKNREVNLVISTELSRISRNMHDFAGIWEMFKANNCSFQSLRENFDTTTAAGEMVLYTIANIAQFERRQVAERVTANMNARAQRGLYNGGPVAFGYDLDTTKVGTLKLHVQHSQIVKEIFNVYLKTESISLTAKYLNDQGYVHGLSSRGGGPQKRVHHFTVDIVRRILTNKTYIAVRHFKEKGKLVEVPAVWEAIVYKNIFYKAQEILQKGNHQRKKHTTTRYPYLLTSLVVCRKCKDIMCGKSAWGRNGKIGYYEHGWATKQNASLSKKIFKCSPHRVPAVKLEQVVVDELFKLLSSDQILKDLFAEAKAISNENSTEKERLKLKSRESSYLKQLEALSARLAELPINVSAQSIYLQMAKIENLKTSVSEQIQKLQFEVKPQAAEFSDVVDFAKLIKDVLLNNNNPELKALVISKFIKKIEVGVDSVLVHYYVGENHFKRELATAGSSFNVSTANTANSTENNLEVFGSNSLTNGGR